MTDHEPRRPVRSAQGARAISDPRKLLAAVSLLGASLGVSAAAATPVDQPGNAPAPNAAAAPVRLAETKLLTNPGIGTSTKMMGWDVKPGLNSQLKVESNQYKSNLHKSNQVKFKGSTSPSN